MKLNKEFFSNMIINPYGDEFDIEDYRDQLNKMMGGIWNKRSKNLEKSVKYILYMYDIASPLRRQFTNMDQRKKECASLAGFDMDNGKDVADAERLYSFTDETYLGFIIEFLKYQNNKTWALLVSNEEVLFQYQAQLVKPITETKSGKDHLQGLEIKGKLMAECDKIIDRIEVYEEKIFGQDKNLMEQAKSAPVTPEQIATN